MKIEEINVGDWIYSKDSTECFQVVGKDLKSVTVFAVYSSNYKKGPCKNEKFIIISSTKLAEYKRRDYSYLGGCV
jgi:hypothetical protein